MLDVELSERSHPSNGASRRSPQPGPAPQGTPPNNNVAAPARLGNNFRALARAADGVGQAVRLADRQLPRLEKHRHALTHSNRPTVLFSDNVKSDHDACLQECPTRNGGHRPASDNRKPRSHSIQHWCRRRFPANGAHRRARQSGVILPVTARPGQCTIADIGPIGQPLRPLANPATTSGRSAARA